MSAESDLSEIRAALKEWDEVPNFSTRDLANVVVEYTDDPDVYEVTVRYIRIYGDVMNRAQHDDLDAAEEAFMSAVRKLCEAEKGGES